MAERKVYSAGHPPPKVIYENGGPSMTKQEFAKAADINNIVARFKKDGLFPREPTNLVYADITKMGSYVEAQAHIDMIDGKFMELPSETRAKFDNDPAVFVDFISEDANFAKLEEMGIIMDMDAPPTVEVPPDPSAVSETPPAE